ncbi:nitrate- and nitrite sensing domain-containing protein [Actinoplanes hulinensis]|uniref:histidine kinase n=1 Tax=Actinoplanes hulinensis TaxID=1144547 RepID=A0ABS7ATY7_9ACTN|nr:nitrate- and nitrite sensing domain-containing protein [Actinoplanes hulinensis]MBW6432255.1 nitrate- and nitrite sensing domain-containing protein [Actinoplanes hulinensis]
MRSRNWSIRSKIIAMVAVPLSAVLALWIFATSVTVSPASHLLDARESVLTLGDPGMRLIGQLQRERHYSAIYQATTRPSKTELAQERVMTDRLVGEVRAAARKADASEDVTTRVDALLAELDKLGQIRREVDDRKTSYFYTAQDFDRIIESAFEVSRSAAVFFHDRVDREVRGLISAFRGLEYMSRIDALLAGANAQGRIDAKTRETLILYVGTSRYLINAGVADMPERAKGDYSRLITHPSFVKIDELTNALLAERYAGGPPPVNGVTWQAEYDFVSQEMRDFTMRVVDDVAEDATPYAIDIIGKLAVGALLGVVALGMSVYVSVRLGRSIVGRLIRLRRDALELASERLPSVVRRLQRGEIVDVEVETPPLEYGLDEIGQLGHAFNDVQRTAVHSAVEEANVRRGINEVFLNIARRSQTLLHRQLSLLDRMERRETDPQELEDLYRVDHLATRMRRHAEDLVILAGAAPGRGWRNPVPMIDVVRGAISEVEDYKRVDIRSIPTAALFGRAVGDVIHLLAELIENAASYSPPHTRVQVIGQLLPNGYAVEIEDRGLGMSPEALEQTNRRLAEPPDFDPADSARLGLFVVAQLAHRHGIRVSLRASAYGGVTAVALIPGDLVTGGPGGGRPTNGSAPGPLVGTGTEDPSRSLAALQWQGSGELKQITTSGRRATVADEKPAHDGVTVNGHHRAAAELTGPAPSTVAAELSAEGLVQRRRTRKSATPPPATPPTDVADQTIDMSVLDELAAGLPTAPRAVPRNSAPPALDAPPASDAPDLEVPDLEVPDLEVPDLDTSSIEDAEATVPLPELSGDDGLPRRVRQASLAPQLRQAPPAEEPPSTAPARSPEQVRTLMSALQLGTTRGRVDAARAESAAGHAGAPTDVTPGDAATVSLPALPTAEENENAPSGPEVGVSGDHAEGPGENLLLEKDA